VFNPITGKEYRDWDEEQKTSEKEAYLKTIYHPCPKDNLPGHRIETVLFVPSSTK